jgi:predicted enzyme related to lactoylglutathione lyase
MEAKKKVTGIGGVFVKSEDPAKMREWYAQHLGFKDDKYGSNFEWRKMDKPEEIGTTVWTPFPNDTKYFGNPDKQFMLNLRVEDLDGLLADLKNEGIEQIGETQTFDFGKFAYIQDLEGNKLELWEPKD